jgi:hypothetical protein
MIKFGGLIRSTQEHELEQPGLTEVLEYLIEYFGWDATEIAKHARLVTDGILGQRVVRNFLEAKHAGHRQHLFVASQ